MVVVLRRGNDQIVTLPGLRTVATPPTYLNAATVIASLYDPDGRLLQTPTLAYVADSDGDYQWMIEGPAFLYPVSTRYRLEVVAVQTGQDFRIVYPVSIVD